jgi:hypothetical protein
VEGIWGGGGGSPLFNMPKGEGHPNVLKGVGSLTVHCIILNKILGGRGVRLQLATNTE